MKMFDFFNNISTKIIIVGVIFVAIFCLGYKVRSYSASKEMDEWRRQANGDLTSKEIALETANQELGTTNAKLKKALSDLDTTNAAFEKFKKDNQLVLKSKDEIIAQLQSQLTGGTSNTNVSCDLPPNCIISYDWQDNFGRFKLHDPNIFSKKDAVFTANQLFVIKGQVYKQKNSYLETRRVEIAEVYRDGDKYKMIPNSSARVIDSTFEYVDNPEDQNNKLFTLRLFGGVGYNFNDTGILAGIEVLKLKNFGLVANTYFDTQTIKKSELGIGVDYNLKPFNVPLNIAPVVSVQTPFSSLFNKVGVSFGVIFFIN